MLKGYDKWRKKNKLIDTRSARYTYKIIKRERDLDILAICILAFIVLAVIVFITILLDPTEKTYTTPAGEYTCRGTIVKVCTGDKEVMDFLGA